MPSKKSISRKSSGAANRRDLDRETKKILRLKDAIARNFWDLGDSLVRVHDGKLYLDADYGSFDEYLRKTVKIGRSTAYRLMELARHFSRETAGKFGQEKLLGAIAYAKATPEPERPFDVTHYTIETKNAAGKKIKKSFSQASAKEVKRAAALLKRKMKGAEPSFQVPLPDMSALLSGKTLKFRIGPFLKSAREKLKAVTPRPTVSATVSKEAEEPLVDMRLGNVRANSMVQVLGLLCAAALDSWMGRVK